MRKITVLALFLGLLFPASSMASAYGSDVTGLFTTASSCPSSTATLKSLTNLRRAGATTAVTDAQWALTEPSPNKYNWSYDDCMATALAKAHLRWIPMLGYTPQWAQVRTRPLFFKFKAGVPGVAPEPPRHIYYYSNYVAAFAHRYGIHGTFWKDNPTVSYLPVTHYEIWNEPDDPLTWGHHVDLDLYGQMYEAARAAIHRQNPRGVAITAGLAFHLGSMERLLLALKGKPVDEIGIHAYAATGKASVASVVNQIALINAAGREHTPVAVDEFGWTDLRGQTFQKTSEANRNLYLKQAIVGLSHIRRVSSIIPFEWAGRSWGLSTQLGYDITQAR